MIHYVCRYCNHSLGQIDQQLLSDERLGFNTLTREERESIIRYEDNGDLTAAIVCEDCQTAIDQNPELLLHPSIHH